MDSTWRSPAHRRLRRAITIAVGGLFLAAAATLVFFALRDSIVFFYGPSELAARELSAEQTVRLGGLVEEGSVEEGQDGVLRFRVTDLEAAVPVAYRGPLPDLFREGQGVVAEGHYRNGVLEAKQILAKHDENYMPRDVVDALKKAGTWQDEGAGY